MDSQTPPAKPPKRFFDIVPQSKTVPSASSRPIVVTNQPEQADPMVNSEPSIPVDKPTPQPPAEASITIAEAMESASEPIKLDTSEPKPSQPVDPGEVPAVSSEPDTEVNLHDMPLELPATTASNVTVVHHSHSASTLRNVMLVVFIVIMVVVVADLVLDIGLLKLSLPHTHIFIR